MMPRVLARMSERFGGMSRSDTSPTPHIVCAVNGNRDFCVVFNRRDLTWRCSPLTVGHDRKTDHDDTFMSNARAVYMAAKAAAFLALCEDDAWLWSEKAWEEIEDE